MVFHVLIVFYFLQKSDALNLNSSFGSDHSSSDCCLSQ